LDATGKKKKNRNSRPDNFTQGENTSGFSTVLGEKGKEGRKEEECSCATGDRA